MSSKDEPDLVRNKDPLTEPSTVQTLKSNLDSAHYQSNGDTSPVNGEKSTDSDTVNNEATVENSVKPSTPSNWVQFDNEDDRDKHESPNAYKQNVTQQSPSVPSQPPPVLTTESVHINIKNLPSSQAQKPLPSSSPAVIEIESKNNLNKSVTTTFSTPTPTPNEQGLRTIELSSGRVREGFANGDVIVTLLPINTRWPWITPALFRPELVPEELMAQGLTLTVEEYVHAMETLVNDFRFTLYNVCYKRVLLVWVVFAFCVLLGLLFSGLRGIPLFSLGVGWLFLNAAAIFMCMWVKLRLARGLERCLASVNKQLIRHKIILALDDRGRISCHKVNLCFMYYDPEQCVNYLNDFIERSEQNGNTIQAGWESRLDVDVNDIVIQGSNTTRVSKKKDNRYLRKDAQNAEKIKIEKELKELKLENEGLKNLVTDLKAQAAEKTQIEKDLKEMMFENEQLQTVVDDLNQKSKIVRTENTKLKQTCEELIVEAEALFNENKTFRAKIDTLERELQHPVMLATNQIEDGGECHVHNSEASGVDHVSGLKGDSFIWQKIIEKKQYVSKEFELKKTPDVAGQLESFINENVYEDTPDSFVREAVKILFSKSFFLNTLAFKNEKDRVCVKDTKIMKCLGESLQTKVEKELIGEDVQDVIQSSMQRFKRHLRSNPSIWEEEQIDNNILLK